MRLRIFNISYFINMFHIRNFTIPEILGGTLKCWESRDMATGVYGKNNQGLLLRLSRWIGLPNFTFVALCDPEILDSTLKIREPRDRAMTLFRKKIITGDLFRLSLWIGLPNFTFVALPVTEILWGTLKFSESRDQGHAPFSIKIIKGFSLACHCEYAYQILQS